VSSLPINQCQLKGTLTSYDIAENAKESGNIATQAKNRVTDKVIEVRPEAD